MNTRMPPNSMFHVQRTLKRGSNPNQQDGRDYFIQLSGDNDVHKEWKKVEYHNPKDLSWSQF
ncbi:unnamed protein product (macronuclear) [Paramecium tetraurelia]|uniref:Uncharacterized protein n=1 Tax=Paramecium tetraurelia TaxID=5888 RepID=A0CLW4_PARTE|nr:uncharacterized protein GSPATT00038706001 [Paramecium tetraurelia]CAK71781.1 unnamed protein product [Paramecium tetraurelia]|eukprot:XP_001439178.1 hypothetical protein (macronuclear) [Paramecium tetraurelia strain d4-2]